MSYLHNIWDKITDLGHRLTGIPTAAERRAASTAINDQIKAYRTQTELSRQEVAAKKDEQVAEKRRIEEKQVRALRRNYRASGFLGSASTTQPDMSSKLGG